MTALRNVRVAFLAALAVVLMTACAHNPVEPTTVGSAPPLVAPAAITTGTWNLQSLTRADSSTVAIAQPGQFTLQLGDDSRILLRADCNRGTGRYTVIGNTLMVGPLAATKAYCGSASLDNEYLQLIGGTTSVSATTTTLQLSSSRGTLLFGR